MLRRLGPCDCNCINAKLRIVLLEQLSQYELCLWRVFCFTVVALFAAPLETLEPEAWEEVEVLRLRDALAMSEGVGDDRPFVGPTW